MKSCEHYQDCLDDPTRDKDMEERCKECNELSTELLNNPEVNEDAGPMEANHTAADPLHKEELQSISSLMIEIENAIRMKEYLHAAELAGIAKQRLDKRIERMFL